MVPVELATKGQRLANYLIDTAVIFVFGYLVGEILGKIAFKIPVILDFLIWTSTQGKLGEYLLGVILTIIYYPFFESIFYLTPGKILTKTTVITENGQKPTFINILGRTFCRFIPFEFFSFLGNPGRGWHDTISKTRVVRSEKRNVVVPSLITSLIIVIGGFLLLESEGVFENFYANKNYETEIFNIQDISFMHQKNWTTEEGIDEENLGYWITCEKNGSFATEIITITVIEMDLDLEEWILTMPDIIRDEPIFKNATFGSVSETDFAGNSAFTLSFEVTYFSEKLYGQVFTFFKNDKSILIMKQSDSETNLKTEFELIEKTLQVH